MRFPLDEPGLGGSSPKSHILVQGNEVPTTSPELCAYFMEDYLNRSKTI